MKTYNESGYVYEVLDLLVQLDLQPLEFKVKRKIESDLKDYVLDELIKIFDLPTNLENSVDFVKLIDRNI